MSGFLIDISRDHSCKKSFEAALSLHHNSAICTNESIINISEPAYQIRCMDTHDYVRHAWIEQQTHSFVYTLGWCYAINSDHDGITDSDAEHMLQRYRRGLPPVSDAFSGQYVVIAYDACTQTITIQPDHWAQASVYFATSPHGVSISNRATAVASLASASFDGYSVLSLMRGTHPPFGRSLFNGVRRLMCGDYLTIDISAVNLRVKQASPVFIQPQKTTMKDATMLLSEKLLGITHRATRHGKVLCDLTGGNDSRLTAAAIAHPIKPDFGNHLTWIVAGAKDHPDVQIAQQIADLFDWRLLRSDPSSPSDTSRESLQDAAVYSDGTTLINSAYPRYVKECAHRSQYDWHVGSIGGELLRGFFWTQEMLSLGKTSQVNFKNMLAYRLYASHGVNTDIFECEFPSIHTHDEVFMAPYYAIESQEKDLLNPYKLDTLYMHKLCYSSGASFSWLMGLDHLRFPLLSWEITQFVLSIPWQLRAKRQLLLKVLAHLSPALSHIPNDTRIPMAPLGLKTWPAYTTAGFRRLLNIAPRIARKMYRNSAQHTAGIAERPPSTWIEYVRELKYLDSYVNRSTVHDMLQNVQSPTRTTDQISIFYTLLTLDLLLSGVPNLQAKLTFNDTAG